MGVPGEHVPAPVEEEPARNVPTRARVKGAVELDECVGQLTANGDERQRGQAAEHHVLLVLRLGHADGGRVAAAVLLVYRSSPARLLRAQCS